MGSVATAPEVVAQATTQPERTWATREEISEAVELDCESRGVRCYPYLRENVITLYEAHRKRLVVGGDGTTTCEQLARDIGASEQSVRNWLNLLARHGLIAKSTLRTAAGKDLGLRVDLLAVPEEVSRRAFGARGCSSVG